MSAECSTTVSAISSAPRRLTASPRARCAARMRATSPMSSAVERRVERVDEILAQVGDEAAERIGEARPRRHQHLRQAELAGERDGMQRPGAAEGEQREVARVVAARQRHHADRAGHVRVGEPGSRPRRRLPASRPSGAADLRRRRSPRTGPTAPASSTASSAAGSSRPSTRLASVMVGSRAAAAVADRPGIGAGALRPDLQHARPRRREAIEPPPAPTVRTSTIGTWIGRP